MINIKLIENLAELNKISSTNEIVNFLFTHLGQYGDSKKAIEKCLDYVFSTMEGSGGFLLNAYYANSLIGVLIMNKTGMNDYIPEYILVYIAVDSKYRGKGFGKEIIKKALELTKGDVELHIEYNNPAKRLYERIGFENKYADMRYYKEKQ
jgi:ribosomal protein S18 acetylase RimI-like enzyme